LPLYSQSDFEYAISRHKGNKIVLLGAQNTNEIGKWRQTIDADGIYEHGFLMLSSENLSSSLVVIGDKKFELWLRQRYGLSASAGWAALDLENKLIVSGVQTPSSKELEQMLDRSGIKSPLRQLRDFLRENPDHIDAMTDMLKEVRRRALHVMPPNTTEDLDTETDLRTWGVLAAETDKVFNGNWLGLELSFFRSDQIPPERFSKLMKNVFRKHISKIESAIQLEPANNALWNIWAWMARGMADYKWETFINTFEPVIFQKSEPFETIPSGEACVWILAEAKAKNDWDTVIKFAKVARFGGYYSGEFKMTWMPFGASWMSMGGKFIDGYPIKSAYAPHLEALLMLGDIDGANYVFDEMIRFDGNAENARIAAEIARSVGMEELAKLWEKGEQIQKIPFARLGYNSNATYLIVLSDNNVVHGEYQKKFWEATRDYHHNFGEGTADFHLDTLGWSKNGGDKWAVVGDDGLVIAQGSDMPSQESLHTIFSNIKSPFDLYQQYITEHGSYPGLDLRLALYDGQNEIALAQVTGRLNKVLREYPEILINMSEAGLHIPFSKVSTALKSLSKPMLTNIESLLERKPSSKILWYQWVLWKKIEGEDYSLESIVERVKPSPFAQPGTGTVLPLFLIDLYYQECKKNGNWPKVIGLLKIAWDREFSKVDDIDTHNTDKGTLGDLLGIHLIEAYLYDNRYREADEVYNAVLEVGGKFTDISKIVELAKEKGQERLAREWENRVRK
jgi:hypothetical protein